ncbi:MAG: transglycosylase domain-containing protein [Leptonema sp. (in: Bacteria)]|nr:transglycosylase domain-containing protein [Leptonema sp. (in: bacteria)]
MSQYNESVFNPPEGVGLLSRLFFPILYRQLNRLIGATGREIGRSLLFVAGLLFSIVLLITFTIADPLWVWFDEGYEEPSIVYGVDAKGLPQEYAEFYNFNRRLISLTDDDMKKLPIVASFVASEDSRFFYHFCVDITGIIRAVFVNLAAGRIKEGASTITQQAARLRFLDRQRSFARKAREASLATLMELKYPKREILEIYFNEVPLGHGTLGVEAASKFFFDKPAKEVNWGEATVLSSLTTSPRNYSPLKYPRSSMAKIKVTFRRLVENGALSPKQAEQEYNNIINNYFLTLNRPPDESSFSRRRNDFPYATEYLRVHALPKEFRPELNRAGYKIYTTLRVDKQSVAESVMVDWLKHLNRTRVTPKKVFTNFEAFDDHFGESYPILSNLFGIAPFKVKMTRSKRDLQIKYLKEMRNELILLGYLSGESNYISALERDLSRLSLNPEEKIDHIEGSLISLQPQTGAIEALIGGSGFTPNNQLLRFLSPRQTGSTFKPILYAAGLEYTKDHLNATKTLTAATVLEDAPVEFINEDLSEYQPENYGGSYMGPIRLRKALTLSRNIWAINAYLHLGGSNVNPYMERYLSLVEGTLPSEASIALGSFDISPLQLASTYGIFANQGKKVEPYFIERIESKTGEVLYQRPETQPEQKMSAETAYIMTSLLQEVVEKGTGTAARIPGLPVAGKTGTTNRYGGAWFAGFVPDNVTVVQFAYDFNKTMGGGATGGAISAPPWRKFMERTYNRDVARSYLRPAGVVTAKICADSGQKPAPNCPDTIDELFIDGTVPTQICEIHSGSKSFDKDNSDSTDSTPTIDFDPGF